MFEGTTFLSPAVDRPLAGFSGPGSSPGWSRTSCRQATATFPLWFLEMQLSLNLVFCSHIYFSPYLQDLSYAIESSLKLSSAWPHLGHFSTSSKPVVVSIEVSPSPHSLSPNFEQYAHRLDLTLKSDISVYASTVSHDTLVKAHASNKFT